jgi:tetratricopeptide (TPR) repeat protein
MDLPAKRGLPAASNGAQLMQTHTQEVKKSYSRILAAVCLSWTLLYVPATAAVAATPSNLDRAQRFYAAGDAANALKTLDLVIRTNPSDATAQYLKANCLVKLARLPEAISSYSLAERLSPKSMIAEYSRTARMRIDSMLAARNAQVTQATQAAQAEESSTADDDTTAPAKNNSLPPGTIELIRKQAALARASAAQTGAAEAENERQKASFQVKTVQERVERMSGLRGNSSNEPVALSPQELEAARSQATAATERLKQLGDMKATIKEQEAQAKQDEIQNQANNLEDQLVNDRPHQISQVKLNPVGTNLYIRNYSSAHPPAVALRAHYAKSITTDTDATLRSTEALGKINANTTNGKRSTPSSQGQGLHSVTSVKGKVLPK